MVFLRNLTSFHGDFEKKNDPDHYKSSGELRQNHEQNSEQDSDRFLREIPTESLAGFRQNPEGDSDRILRGIPTES